MSVTISRTIKFKGQDKFLYETSINNFLYMIGMKDNEFKIYNMILNTYDLLFKMKIPSFKIPNIKKYKNGYLIEKIITKFHLKITDSISFFDVRYGKFKYLDMEEIWEKHTIPISLRIKYIEAIGEFLAILKFNKITCEEFEVIIDKNDNIYMLDFGECFIQERNGIPKIEKSVFPFYEITQNNVNLYTNILINRYNETLQIIC